MTKKLKLNIKNTQIAKALDLGSLKDKLAKKKVAPKEGEKKKKAPAKKPAAGAKKAPAAKAQAKPKTAAKKKTEKAKTAKAKTAKAKAKSKPKAKPTKKEKPPVIEEAPAVEEAAPAPKIKARKKSAFSPTPKKTEELEAKVTSKEKPVEEGTPTTSAKRTFETPTERKLGPTGKHVKDLLPPAKPKREPPQRIAHEDKAAPKPKPAEPPSPDKMDQKRGKSKFKEFQDLKPSRKMQQMRPYGPRDRRGGLREDERRRKPRAHRTTQASEEEITPDRPKELSIRLPISIKDLAGEMKLKASQLIAFLFKQGVAMTINDFLDDETTAQLLGQEFECEIKIDTSEEERIRITDKTIKEEISESPTEELIIRPPVVTFMGHVDHGKTSLIDVIRESNRIAGEAGEITQHIGAFRCKTKVGDIAILDTPGHEAFSAMRARGADVTDIVVLVVAGDEGVMQQTLEAIQHAKAAGVTIVVAINKSDKPGFNAEDVYRQLADNDLLPEAWGGQTITINCSAITKEGVPELLEMLALQAEVLELKSNPKQRARGSVLESELHKGRGTVATVLVQNGTLKQGDAVVFEQHWGKIRTMQDEYGRNLEEADPSTPVEVTGLSGIPAAGQEFIVVESEKEAREIAEMRATGIRQQRMQKKSTMESLFQEAEEGKKVLNVVLRADMQGSLEALKVALEKIESEKARLEIIFSGIGEVSESDVQLAAASNAIIMGFHTSVEAHADELVKQYNIQVHLHDIIYHAIDDIKLMLTGLLDKIAEEKDIGKAEVIATFKSSQVGIIAGCMITEGLIHRNHHIRQLRGGEVIWKGTLDSIKREKEDVKEVAKGLECGLVLAGNRDIEVGDLLESYEIIYKEQEL